MPILGRETDIFPDDLLDAREASDNDATQWWALYTRAKKEKELMRRLLAMRIPFYGPTIAKRSRSPSGRVRTSYLPLFQGYVFLFADAEQRREALTTNCISRTLEVPDGAALLGDLQRIRAIIESGAPVTREETLPPGTRVRVCSGSLRGIEGIVIERRNETRLLVAVDFLQQGASVLLDDCAVERLD